MGKLIDIIGRRFTRLVVVERAASDKNRNPIWIVRCDCGQEKTVLGQSLHSGIVRSCGCLHKEAAAQLGKGHLKDLTNMRFGKWLVIGRAPNRAGQLRWTCLCECGNRSIIAGNSLRCGKSTSCGVKHGHAAGLGSPTYASWRSMLTRCFNSENNTYRFYGAKGITICDRWNPAKGGSFENFLEDLGFRPSKEHTLSRLLDSGNYELGNVVWGDPAHQKEQKRLKRLLAKKPPQSAGQEGMEKAS
jgi:hypothetical protein